MQLKDLGQTLARRWYLTLAGLLGTVGLCVAAFVLVPPTYQTEADIVLLPPESSVGEGGNPYLYLGGLDQASDVLTRALTSDASRNEVLDALGQADYDVQPDWSTSGPILIITGRGDSPEAADEVRGAVLDRVPTTLQTLQRALNVPESSQITSMILTSDDEPTAVVKTQLRAVAAAGVVGAVAAIMLIGLVDGLLATRTRRRAVQQARRTSPRDSQEAATRTANEARRGTGTGDASSRRTTLEDLDALLQLTGPGDDVVVPRDERR